MHTSLQVLPEPELEFRYRQRLQDPRDGLSLFGPYDADMPSHPRSIIYAAIGAVPSLRQLPEWSKSFAGPMLTESEPYYDPRNWPHFPGFRSSYDCEWPNEPAWEHSLDRDKVLEIANDLDPYHRAGGLVDMYINAIEIAAQRDEGFHVLLCIVPDEVWKNCRPESTLETGTGFPIPRAERELRAAGPDLFGSYNPTDYVRSVDFRRQLKARAMSFGIPLQIIRESTLRWHDTEGKQPARTVPKSAVAWFLSSALYYKSGGKPWRLCSAREGVCYVGLTFRRTPEIPHSPSTSACCAAQMFLDTGDGVVFKGELGPWYSPETKECHLSANAAEELLSGVLKTYSELGGKPLGEIFLHSRSAINEEEFEGYSHACPKGVTLTGIRVRRDAASIKLFRNGEFPVLRGTYLAISERTCFLWSSGFKLRLETYDGFDVPHPLRIDVQHGEGSIRQIAEDILGLTKLNYNSCRLGQTEPVTIGFSNHVGEILVSNPEERGAKPQFKFYI